MDDRHFDALTTFLATRPSRRRMLRILLGLGGGLATVGTPAASASAFICRAGGVLCAKDAHCCSGTCDHGHHRCTCADGQPLCHGRCCETGDVCVENACCQPESIETICAGRCEVVTNNCGQQIDCTAVCAGCCAGDVCAEGTADAACGAGGVDCAVCAAPETCGGGDKPQACGCTPDNGAACQGTTCPGIVINNCGQSVDCGYREIHGGCFKEGGPNCLSCPAACNYQCATGIGGSEASLCFTQLFQACTSNADCPSGSACHPSYDCVVPC